MREVLYFLVCAMLARLQVKYCPYYAPYHKCDPCMMDESTVAVYCNSDKCKFPCNPVSVVAALG